MLRPRLPLPGYRAILRAAGFAACGLPLAFILGLHPVWWLAWFAPVPLLVLSWRAGGAAPRGLVFVAALVGVSANAHYYQVVFSWPWASAVLLIQASLWVAVIRGAGRVVVRYAAWWTAFAYPVVWAAVDTLFAALLPDGNWGSLAYTQAPCLPVLQVASLCGTAGVAFLVSLVPSALALGLVYGRKLRRAGWLYGATLALVGVALVFGTARLREPHPGRPTTFGLVAIDDAIGPRASAAYIKSIWDAYDRQIDALGKQGAEIIVLPEKIGLVPPALAQQWQRHLSALAAGHRMWIVAGIAVAEPESQTNTCWLFAPDGVLAATYQKHHLSPGERHHLPPTAAGTTYAVQTVADRTYGLAICKDMHFASLGRAYGLRDVSMMLVPAWDFGLDRWLEARTTVVRGVEDGYSIVRCAREGLMTVSDPCGRIVAEAPSGPLPGRSLLVTTAVGAPLTTGYTRMGDGFGWVCVAAAACLMVIGRPSRPRAPGGAGALTAVAPQG